MMWSLKFLDLLTECVFDCDTGCSAKNDYYFFMQTAGDSTLNEKP